MIRVLLADDHETVREGLRLLVNAQADMQVVGEAGNGQEALDGVVALRPNVVVLDLTMPGMGGLIAARALKKVAETVLDKGKVLKTHLLSFDEEGFVRSKDISALDPGDEDDDVSGWGGLAGFSSQFGEAVRRAANEAEE